MTKKLDNNHYAGHYTIKKRKVGQNSEEAVVVADFENLITTVGITRNLSGGIWVNSYCLFGTGTTAPAASDTSLEQPIGSLSTNGFAGMSWNGTPVPVQVTTLPHEYKISAVANFTPGIVSGNLTEIGIYQYNSLGEPILFSRALIKDANGNPTTLTVLPDEYLDVYYYVRTFYNPIATPFSININGVAKTGTYYYRLGDPAVYGGSIQELFSKPSNINFYTGTLNAADPVSSLSNGDLTTIRGDWLNSPDVYTDGNKFVDLTMSYLPAHGAWDFDVMVFGNNPYHFFKFNQRISKLDTENLNITYRYSWDKA